MNGNGRVSFYRRLFNTVLEQVGVGMKIGQVIGRNNLGLNNLLGGYLIGVVLLIVLRAKSYT